MPTCPHTHTHTHTHTVAIFFLVFLKVPHQQIDDPVRLGKVLDTHTHTHTHTHTQKDDWIRWNSITCCWNGTGVVATVGEEERPGHLAARAHCWFGLVCFFSDHNWNDWNSVRVCVCVCVCGRERERERERADAVDRSRRRFE